MAGTKKYAGLPDLDDAGTELYQTPGLTDDASTIQTSTIRTESPTPSERSNENFDRTRFDREEARRRFEPAVVDAKDVNFSYAVGGNQKSYISRHRRRRMVRRSNGVEEYGDLSDDDGSETEETLSQKLARLKREAEEVRLEIERREKDDAEFQDSFEHQQGNADNDEHDTDLPRTMNELNRILYGLESSSGSRVGMLEQEFSRQLDVNHLSQTKASQPTANESKDTQPNTTINTISAFSDRISAIESALGLSTISPATIPIAILPTLDTLSNQINLLHSTIVPKPASSIPTQSTSSATDLTPQIPHLDILQTRLHTLHQSATSLLNTRKAAQTALTELETVRLRSIRAADHNLARYQTLANRRANRPTRTGQPYTAGDSDSDTQAARPVSRGGARRRNTATEEAKERLEIADEIVTPLFLEDQAEKIKALYNVLPTIQNLQPLLPVVLERLRGLSVVHTGAASAREDMDAVEGRLKEWEAELAKWQEAVEGVESGIQEMKEIMKDNVNVVGEMVRGVETRIENLDREK